MLKSITGTISACAIKKTGTSDKGRAWTIFDVVINGEHFSTFDTKYQENIGKEGTFEYEEVQKGQYLNKTLQSYPEIGGSKGAGGHPTVRNNIKTIIMTDENKRPNEEVENTQPQEESSPEKTSQEESPEKENSKKCPTCGSEQTDPPKDEDAKNEDSDKDEKEPE